MTNNLIKQLGVASLIIILSLAAKSQTSVTAKNKSPFPVKYTSLTDQKIMLKTITLAPVYDNTNGIYAQPIQKLLIDLLKSDKVWGYSEFPDITKKMFIEKFDSEPNDVLEALTRTNAQGLLTAYITKGPRGLNAKLKLFTHDQGLVLIEESFQDLSIFEISKLRDQFVIMYQSIKNRLPYRGYVLSRRGLDVTLNLGSMNGVHLDQELSLAQILKLNRHPKLKTMVGVEKEIIAKLKVTKVEPYLSFAQIIFEKETGVVDVGAKVLPSEYVAYPKPIINSEGAVTGDDASSALIPTTQHNEPVASNNDQIQKTPDDTAEKQIAKIFDRNNSFGIFTIQGLITQYKESTELISGTNVSASNSVAPGINLAVQIYPLKNIFVSVGTQLSNFGRNNTLAGSTPIGLSYTLSRHTGYVGYDYTFEDSEPSDQIKFSAALGFASLQTNVTTTTPTAFTSTQTDTMALQLKAAMPLAPEYPITIGAQFDIFFSPKLAESPVDSGTGKPSLTSFGLFGVYPVSDKLNVRIDLGVMNINANFSGTGSRTNPAASNSIQTVSEQLGIEYLF